jgi:hypothetical protein
VGRWSLDVQAADCPRGICRRGAGEPLFQAAAANFNPWTEAKVDTKNPDRAWAIANASYNRQKRNPGVTEIVQIAGRGHALTIDSGWRYVADLSLAFVKRFVDSKPASAG